MAAYTEFSGSAVYETLAEAVAALDVALGVVEAGQKNLNMGIVPVEGTRWAYWYFYTTEE